MTTAEKIRFILQATGWNQGQLASRLGVSAAAVSFWLAEKPIRDNTAREIERYYGHARRLVWECSQPALDRTRSAPRVLSKRGKIVFPFPWYSHQKGVIGR